MKLALLGVFTLFLNLCLAAQFTVHIGIKSQQVNPILRYVLRDVHQNVVGQGVFVVTPDPNTFLAEIDQVEDFDLIEVFDDTNPNNPDFLGAIDVQAQNHLVILGANPMNPSLNAHSVPFCTENDACFIQSHAY